MEQPKVSIMMGIYNCETILPTAINSLLNQTYCNWELIMCDDGSTDSTYKIASKYADEHSNIIVLQNKKNMRLAYSLNQCLKKATGKYIARMDADDESMPKRLERQVLFMEKHPEFDVVGTALNICDKDKVLYTRYYPEYPMLQKVWSTVPFAHPTIMMRKKVFDQLGGYRVCKETMRAEDLDLWFRFRSAGFSGYNLQEPFYMYQESENDYKKRSLEAAVQTSKLLTKYYKELKIPKKYWLLIIKPIVAALMPNKLMMKYHEKQSYVK